MVKQSKVRYPVHRNIGLKKEMDADIVKVADLTGEPIAEVMRRALERQLPLFLEHALRTGRLLNGEVA